MPGQTQDNMQRDAIIRKMFSRYYRENAVPAPPDLVHREFGFIKDRGMWRHLSFGSPEEMNAFLRKHVPRHGYHSSAYYRVPSARTMNEKEWLGADLVFDLDADHIPGAESMSMEEMLDRVKMEFIKLLEDFLLGDFGFGEEDITIVFSGGRGYHAHVHHKKVLGLGSRERRQIVDYITNPHADIKWMLKRELVGSKEFKGHHKLIDAYKLYPEDTPGWPGKLTRGMIRFLRDMERMPREEVVKEFMRHKGIGKNTAEQIYESLFLGEQGSRGMDLIIRDRNIEVFPRDNVRDKFLDYVHQRVVVSMGGETDEPVTADTKRLIRLPGTLHGKTSLVVKPLTPEQLREFSPLEHGFWSGFGQETMRLHIIDNKYYKLKGKSYELKPNDKIEVPGDIGLFLLCQGCAVIHI